MEERKKDHIELAFQSKTNTEQKDKRFSYEPILTAHPQKTQKEFAFLDKKLKSRLWVSSMTGGTQLANTINTNIAKVCKDFGMGMGLGSCRALLYDKTHFSDFDKRDFIGDDLPFYANLGIAQVIELIKNNDLKRITELIDKLRADGLIIHVNPLQEWLQPEGDKYYSSPLNAIEEVLERLNIKLIIKEVGQGMGYKSLEKLMNLPIEAIEFGAFGGTNFALLEILRNNDDIKGSYMPFINIGHTAAEMIDYINEIYKSNKNIKCKQIIISGGIKNALDGYYFINKSKLPAVYAQASAVLKYAKQSYEALYKYVDSQMQAYRLAESFLKIQ